MLTLVIVSLDGRPVDTERRADFDDHGGTIGASPDCTLVLTDAAGGMPAVAATVAPSPSGYVVHGAAPDVVQVNGHSVESGSDHLLADGDELRIGPWLLRVAMGGAATPASRPTTAELEAAFLAGLGFPNLQIAGGLGPAFMETLGQLLREISSGTIDLLRIRAQAKSSVHADLTMIGSREINPLKAAWDAEVALRHLLAPQRADIMGPVQAMSDAYDDLRLHDRGLAAGIRAALAGLLARFDPEALEKQLADGGMVDSLLASSRKSRGWDLLVELYGDLSVEAEQDFWRIFEKEFLQAYRTGQQDRDREAAAGRAASVSGGR